jgi:uncharacterized protein YprB with RNaseH-like and TPR domain
MLPEELRRRISELNRKDLNVVPLSSIPAPPPKPREIDLTPEPDDTPGFPGEEVQMETGQFWRICITMGEIFPQAKEFLSHFRYIFESGGLSVDTATLHPAVQQFLEFDPGQALYLDIETCGLTSTPLFLVGIMYYKDGDFHLEQLLARDYTEEEPLLDYLADVVDRTGILVTYNGRSFDFPYIVERALLHRKYFDPDKPHFDLLHEARRRWKELLPDCKLQTIERRILRRTRMADIPSADIPEVYHDYVRTGDTVRMKAVLHHNLIDIISMAEIILHMLAGDYRNPDV